MRRFASILLSVGLAGCAAYAAGEQAEAPAAGPTAAAAPGAVAGTEEDPFVLMINAGRMGVFADKIEEAINLTEGAPAIAEAEGPEADLRRAAYSIRQARLDFMRFKTRACGEGKFTDVACTPTPTPVWLAEPADAPVSGAEINRRTEELMEDMGPLLDAACEYGEMKTGEALFCSVE